MARIIPIRAAPTGPSLFGKLPGALDFVRVNHEYPESIGLDRWLQTALQRLAARSERWPAGTLTFVLAAAKAEHALIGVAADSSDRAGRRFPVAIYARVPTPMGCAALPLASADFVADAQRLLERIGTLLHDDIAIELRRLRVPATIALQAAERRLASELAARHLSAFAAPLFPTAPERSARAAFERLRSRRSREGHVLACFDCPVQTPLDVAVWSYWLELAHGQQASGVWSVAPGAQRALLTPGPLPDRAALFWATPQQPHAQLCRVAQAVAPTDAAADSGEEITLGALVERLARETRA